MSRLDTFDLSILRALTRDGRLSNAELADRVGLSASQCARRRARLEEIGVIAGYRAVLDRSAVGLEVGAIVQVTLATHSADEDKGFRALLERTPEVLEADMITGDADYVLRVATPDLAGLARLLNDVLLRHPAVARVHSQIALDRVKENAPPPLDHLSR